MDSKINKFKKTVEKEQICNNLLNYNQIEFFLPLIGRIKFIYVEKSMVSYYLFCLLLPLL